MNGTYIVLGTVAGFFLGCTYTIGVFTYVLHRTERRVRREFGG